MITIKALSLQIILFIIMILRATNLEQNSMESQNTLKQNKQNVPQIVIYTKSYCPYCVKAKRLLEGKALDYTEIDVENNATLLQEMLSKSLGRKTVPQIFLGDKHIGGCDDLYALEESGELDKIISLKQ
jgi:glutaredoxin 3